MLDDLLEFILFVTAGIVGVFVTVMALMLLIWPINSQVCAAYGEGTELKTKYSFWGGCFAEIDGRMVTKDTAEKIITNEYRVKINSD